MYKFKIRTRMVYDIVRIDEENEIEEVITFFGSDKEDADLVLDALQIYGKNDEYTE